MRIGGKETGTKALFFNEGTLASLVLLCLQHLVPKSWQMMKSAMRKAWLKTREHQRHNAIRER